MGVGKNTAKALDSAGDSEKYEEETKDSEGFYPVSVSAAFVSMGPLWSLNVCVFTVSTCTLAHFPPRQCASEISFTIPPPPTLFPFPENFTHFFYSV